MSLKTEIAGYCTLCRSRCGTLNTIENERLVSVRPDPDHPTGKALCPKGRAAPEIAHSVRRLKTPLRRTRPKGEADGGFVAIGWDEALDEIAARLSVFRQESGPQSVAFAMTSGSSSSISDSAEWIQRFIRSYGSPNLISSTEVCNWHKDHAHAFTFGCGLPAADYGHSDLILLWGHNPTNVWLAQAEAIGAARARGAKLVVIDPRQTALAREADLWLRVRPGTDAALALGVARLLIAHQWYDRDFVRDWTNAPFLVDEQSGEFLRGRDLGMNSEAFVLWDRRSGAPRLATDEDCDPVLRGRFEIDINGHRFGCRPSFDVYVEATDAYVPTRVAAITDIPEHQIEAFAALIGSAGSVCYHGWTGLGQHTNASQTDRAIATLYALTGSFDRPGGNVRLPSAPTPSLHSMDLLPPAIRSLTLGLDKLPIGPPLSGWVNSSDFCDAALEAKPYRVRALVTFGANMLIAHPAPDRSRAALAALDFQVHCDLFMNPTAESADIILPVASPWEFEALRIGFEISREAQQHIQLRPAMIPPQGEARSDAWIVFQLAQRLGLTDAFFDGDIEAGFAHQLAPLGLTLDQLRRSPGGIQLDLQHSFEKYKTQGFSTHTGRVEFYSELLKRHGHSPVPLFVEPKEQRSDAFPLTLFSVNNGYFRHSQDRGTTLLRRRRREPVAEIHPDLASRKGIADGQWIRVKTRLGSIRTRAKLTASLAPDVVASDYGWWQAAPDLGLPNRQATNFNALISETERDPISGGLALRSFACDIEADQQSVWTGWRRFVITDRFQHAADVVGLALEPVDSLPLPGFLPGQHVGLRLGDLVRSYSLTGAGQDHPTRYSVAVRKQGRMSGAIWQDLGCGSIVELRAPEGDFVLPLRLEFPVVLIAGGIGITPFLSYLETLEAFDGDATVTLYYACRDSAHRPFHDRLRHIEARRPRVKVVTHLTQPGVSDTCDRVGRFSADDVAQELIDARARFYICAGDTMVEALTAGLQRRGVPAYEIFKERFHAPGHALPDGLAARSIHFVKSGRILKWQPGDPPESILAVAEKAGIPLLSGCRVGQCESCAVVVTSGSVKHLSDLPELEPGYCLTCQAVPLTDLVIDA